MKFKNSKAWLSKKEAMKIVQILFISCFVFCVSQTKLIAQSSNDQQLVLQQCIDLPAMQQYYPIDGNGKLIQANIMKNALLLPDDMNLTLGGMDINYIPQSEISSIPFGGFFTYRNILTEGNKSNVVFNFFYKKNTLNFRIINVNVELEKSGSNWTIKNYNLTGETL